MNATERGKHCSICQTEVIDFAVMSTPEILHYLAQRKKEHKLCVRIKNPDAPFSNTHITRLPKRAKKFLYALAIAFLGFISSPLTLHAEQLKAHHPIEQASKGTGVFGKVTNKKGQPIADAQVALFRGKDRVAIIKTDAQGFFSLSEIPKGVYTLSLHAIGYKEQSKQIKISHKMKRRNFKLKVAHFIFGCPRF